MDRRAWAFIAALGAVAIVAGVAASAIAPPPSADLTALEDRYAREFYEIKHLTPDEVESLQAKGENAIVLLDAREAAEFAVSHIAGARRVPPDSTGEQAADAAGDVGGKTVVVYCSVGYRSSKMATTARKALLAHGARDVANMRGGIFAWRNAEKPLEADGRATARVHPSGGDWTKYLTSNSAAADLPQSSAP
ncbi:MAG: rhodanese-like domain-containing protein [Hyphomicrobium sp.]